MNSNLFKFIVAFSILGISFLVFPKSENNFEFKEKETIEEEPESPIESPQSSEEIVWGNRSKNEVVFTFDAGSGTQSFEAILNNLRKYNIKGTFFITGKWAEANPLLVKRIHNEGYEIFNHTYSHPYLTQIDGSQILEEFEKTEEIIKGITGVSTKPYFRPPFGDRDEEVRKIAANAGYRTVYWTVDVLDWKEEIGFTDEQAKERILANLKPGTIYLMHIGDNITGNILDEVFSEIKDRGYDIVSLTETLDK